MLFAEAYAAQQDGRFSLPALPVDQIPAQLRRQEVDYATTDAPGTVIIDPARKTLHLVTGPNRAIRYGIGVGKAGYEWSGEALITARRAWPTWTPPAEMIERRPELARWRGGQPGGLDNPLGARALYLTTNGVDYGYRIHGTPEWRTIGTNASAGCIRMFNQDVIDLYNRVPDGAKVVVLTPTGERPTKLTLPSPAAAATPKPVVVAAAEALRVTDVGAPEIAMPALPSAPPLDPELVAPAAGPVPSPAP